MLQYILYVLAIPLAVYFAITKLFGAKGEEKKGGEISADKALSEEDRIKTEELMYEATDSSTGDMQ
jgi:hypothetical protein